MKRREKVRVSRNVVEWLDSQSPERRKLLKRAADHAEKLWKARTGEPVR